MPSRRAALRCGLDGDGREGDAPEALAPSERGRVEAQASDCARSHGRSGPFAKCFVLAFAVAGPADVAKRRQGRTAVKHAVPATPRGRRVSSRAQKWPRTAIGPPESTDAPLRRAAFRRGEFFRASRRSCPTMTRRASSFRFGGGRRGRPRFPFLRKRTGRHAVVPTSATAPFQRSARQRGGIEWLRGAPPASTSATALLCAPHDCPEDSGASRRTSCVDERDRAPATPLTPTRRRRLASRRTACVDDHDDVRPPSLVHSEASWGLAAHLLRR